MDPFTTEPHGAQEIRLVDDCKEPANRIYELSETHGFIRNTIGLLGSELESLCNWWLREKQRGMVAPDEPARIPGSPPWREEQGMAPMSEDCEHKPTEDCMICSVCGECSESLDANDVCTDCGGTDENDDG